MTDLSHPVFRQPVDSSALVWRYFDLAKYVSMLIRKTLYFSAATKLGDPFEGTFPKGTKALWEAQHFHPDDSQKIRRNSAENHYKNRAIFTPKLASASFISCWRLDEHESEAMWKLYCGQDQGVAICLPYDRLADSISDPHCFMGCVTYIDYNKAALPFGNTMTPFVHKRIAFEHENEVRLFKEWDKFWEWHYGDIQDSPPLGIEVPWDPSEFVSRVVVSPYAKPWFHDTVRTLTLVLAPALASRVCESAMGAYPDIELPPF